MGGIDDRTEQKRNKKEFRPLTLAPTAIAVAVDVVVVVPHTKNLAFSD